MSDIDKAIAALSPEKRELLARKLKREGSRFRSFPLSFAQERLWFLDQLDPGSPAYNIPLAVRISGRLDPGTLEASISDIIQRHEVLRTTFAVVDGEPRQFVGEGQGFLMDAVDLSGVPDAEREARLAGCMSDEFRTPFNLSSGPLLRAALIRLGVAEHVLLLSIHHIAADGWSMGVLLREIAHQYDSRIRREPSALATLKIQYGDYAVWQRNHLQGEVLEGQLGYWKNALGGELPALNLPTDRPRAAVQALNGAYLTASLPRELGVSLQQLCVREHATLFMGLLAAFDVLLSRYSGQTDLCVGTPIANRTRQEMEGLVGFFVNTLVIRTDLSGRPTFRELLGRVRDASVAAFAHQDVPFEKVVEAVQPERDLSRPPIFQVMFSAGIASPHTLQISGLSLQQMDTGTGTSKFELTMEVNQDPEELRCLVEYNTDLFNEPTIRRMVGHFSNILRAVTRDPDRPVLSLPLMAEEEQRTVLEVWNRTRAPFPATATVRDLFESQVQKSPDAPAVQLEGRQLTYRELNRRANQLARFLRRAGVGTDTIVGVSMERSLEMVVGILGTLKAGGAFVPLDPSYPPDRLAYMIRDAGLRVLLTQDALRNRLNFTEMIVLCLDTEWESVGALEDGDLGVPVDPENLAYVIYTSGSTGRPKGTLLQHRGLCNLATVQAREFKVGPGTRVLQFSSASFDASVWELVMALLSGGTLCLADRDQIADPAAMIALMERQAVTAATIPPSVLSLLPEQPLPDLQVLVTAGEKCPGDLVNRWGGGRKFFNAYGPTETTVCASMHRCVGSYPQGPPIGRPLANVDLYILDANLEPVPVGVPGELCVGGVGLARGYLGRPDLTAEKFIPHRFSAEPGARLYRTGDVCRYREDGDIDFLGRIDDEVKVRGFRIDLGEVEAVIEEHPLVHQAVVVAREDDPGEKRLAAYYVATVPQALSATELRRHLEGKLPDYMVPSAFVPLEKLPLTPSGKVDRRALPVPEYERRHTGADYVAPRSPEEEVLADIWASVLRVPQVGIHDNFFVLGGHSLLATRVAARIRETFKVDVPVRHIFEQPTVALLAQSIRSRLAGGEEFQAPPLLPADRREPMPLTFSQQRLWFLAQLDPDSPQYNIPTVYRIRGPLDTQILERSISHIVDRHEILRTSFHAQDGKAALTIAPQVSVRLGVEDLTSFAEPERLVRALREAQEEARRPIPLSQAPLFRMRLMKVGEADHVFVAVVHHIIADGWSMQIFTRELATVYDSLLRSAAVPLAPLRIQYTDYAVWQHTWLGGSVLDSHLEYWKGALAGAPPMLELPTDHPRPAAQTFEGSHHSFSIAGELADRLRELSRRESASTFMTLLAAFKVLLSRYSGQTDITVGTPIANRTQADLEDLIGFFVNTIVMRTDLSGRPTFREILRRVRDVAFSAYAHQDAPLEKVVEAVHPERSLDHSPLFQVMFVLQNRSLGGERIADLTLEPLDVDTALARYDLTLLISEGERELSCRLEYNTALFEPSTMKRMSGHFLTILALVLADPDGRICDLDLLSGEEREDVLQRWNAASASAIPGKCIHELFEAQVEQTPEALALRCRNRELSYAGLNRLSNRMAHRLVALGVGPDVLVGVCMERSVEAIVAILAVLKAGGGYVPLDHTYPAERLAGMMEDARVHVLVTSRDLAETLPSFEGTVVYPDAEDAAAPGMEANLPCSTDPEHIAYVIFTSGSTGRPKGVMVPHRGLVNLARWCVQHNELGEGSRALGFMSLSFDASADEIFPALTSGAALILHPSPSSATGTELLEFCRKEEITDVHLPAAYWHHLVADAASSRVAVPESLRMLVVGGESPSTEKLALWQSMSQRRRRFINAYGPTELAVVATACEVPHTGWDAGEKIPIGRPIPNAAVYVLDRHGLPQPLGVPGELYVAGAGVSRGYVSRPDLTAERYLPCPWGGTGGGRMYRTGDRVRLLEDGNLEFLGRVDEQVKVRGFRIEPAEIEAAILKHSSVQHAAVVVRAARSGDKHLTAYIVWSGEEVRSVDELRAFLGERLPDFMMPAVFVTLERMPLTSTGKVDRRSLPESEEGRIGVSTSYQAPRTERERILAGIWQTLLSVEKVGIRDNFFDLGGDSILSIQVVARANQAGLRLTPRQVFQHPTIEALASVAEETRITADQGVVTGSAPLTPIQRWFFDQAFAEPDHWNQALLFELTSAVDKDALREAVRLLTVHHDALRLRVEYTDSGWRQKFVDPIDETCFEVVSLAAVPAEKRPDAITSEATRLQRSLDLTSGPILRVAYFDAGSDESARLLMVIHHLAVDAVSWQIILQDLQTILLQLGQGQAPQLPFKTTSYKAWAERLEEHARSTSAREEASYWTHGGSDGRPGVPIEGPWGANDDASASQVSVGLNQEETTILLQEVPSAYGTDMNDALLAALAMALSRWSGGGEVSIDLERHGREEILPDVDLSRTVGWFTTLHPVQLSVRGTLSPGDRLKSVKEQLRRIPGRGLPYLLMRSRPEHREMLVPPSQVSFNYLGQVDQAIPESLPVRLARESAGPQRSESSHRPYILDVSAATVRGTLEVSFTYSRNLHRQETIQNLAGEFVRELRAILQHCTSPGAGGYTPSDFSLAGLDQNRLDKLVRRVSRQEKDS